MLHSLRDIDFAWEEERNSKDFASAARRKTQSMIEDICGALCAAGRAPKTWNA